MIERSLLNQEQFKKVFNYLKEMANHLTIADITKIETENKNVNKDFFKKIYEKVNFISPDSVINSYVSGIKTNDTNMINQTNIYPFSFNLSQKLAIKHAFENNISVIEGPPGTGKTQTILNIISNAIINKKNVAVLSTNNSATDNVYEKLEKHNLSSLCAKLGKLDNIKKFLYDQENISAYPESWAIDNNKENKIRKDLLDMGENIEWYLNEMDLCQVFRHIFSKIE